MSILIDTLRVAGFRGIKNLEIMLSRMTVLIGTNNSGKTSLLKALQLSLGDYSRYLSEEDFYIDSEEKRISEIIIDVRIISADSKGLRVQAFNEEWATEFGDKIKAEADGKQYVAIRTRCKVNLTKGGFDTLRSTLEKWPDFLILEKGKEKINWNTEKIKETRLVNRLLSIPFISMEAQRDIHQELKEKSSFIGKVLSNVEYDKTDVKSLESQIKKINDEAVDKSGVLKSLKVHLEKLNQSFHGAGNAEITPFPKKIRDLSKHFLIHFGDNKSGSFSMEYHGMGTRSWASMLTVKAFTDLMAAKHEEEVEPFFPILSAEEPEAHLHPNAQKTLYRQLEETKGQVIVSTHSPYLAAMIDVTQIRSLVRNGTSGIVAHKISHLLSVEDKKILDREIMMKRGEILFARAMILCEGVTEEQVIPAMFEAYTKYSLFSLGINCISVGGKNYKPFVKLACNLGIPTYIVSDNDGNTYTEIEAQLRRLKKDTGLKLEKNIFGISYLTSGNDFEAEILNEMGMKDEIIASLLLDETKASENKRYRDAKLKDLKALTMTDIVEKLRNSKSSYSGYLADVIRENPNNKDAKDLVPIAVKEAFDSVKGWLSL